jgi:hypothetical protein
MNRHLLPLASLLTLLLPTCRAQLSDLCTTSYVPNVANRAVQLLQTANAKTDVTEKQTSMQEARKDFSNSLNAATTIAACFSAAVEAKSLAAALEARRIDKQVGASGGTSGSTSLVPSGSVPALLGLATEYGGLTESFSGTTATVRTTPAKLLAAMAKAYGPDTTPIDDRTLAALERVSLSVSFDTARTATADTKAGNTLLANYQQLSQASARIILINDRDPLAPKNWKRIREFSQNDSSKSLANEARQLLAPLTQMASYDLALDKAMDAYDALVKSATPDAAGLTNIFRAYLEEIQKLTLLVPDWHGRLDRYVAARLKLNTEHKNLYQQISKAPTLSLELALNRPPVVSASSSMASTGTAAVPPTGAAASNAPDLSTASLIFTASLLSSEYTLNAKANFFNQTRPGMRGNFRDFQVSGKLDVPVGNVPSFIAKGTLTFSGLFEHLHQKPLGINLTINDQTVNQPGNIGVFQAKYSIPIGDSGIQVPISFTASNRTELIKEKEMRGNIGISFDLDKLFTKK